MEDRKSKILSEIDRDREELEELSRKIHDDPELGFEEFHALSYISDVLKKHGYRVEQGYGGLETSFRAEKEGSKPGPTVAFLAEYDALKGGFSGTRFRDGRSPGKSMYHRNTCGRRRCRKGKASEKWGV